MAIIWRGAYTGGSLSTAGSDRTVAGDSDGRSGVMVKDAKWHPVREVWLSPTTAPLLPTRPFCTWHTASQRVGTGGPLQISHL